MEINNLSSLDKTDKQDNKIDIIEIKKEKLKRFFRDKLFLSFFGVLFVAVIFRLYFFLKVKDQTHWWDTLAYGGIAKNLIYHRWDESIYIINEAIIRPPILPYIWSFLLRIGFSDATSIFFLQILPSVASVVFIFLIVLELYGKRAAILTSLLLSFSWIHAFYTMRIMTDVPSLFFSLASIYFFVKTYKKIETRTFALSIFFLCLAFLTRYVYALLGIIYLAFLFVHHKHRLLKFKNFYIGGIIGVSPIILFFMINLFTYGSILPATDVYSAGAESTPSFAFYTFSFIPYILKSILMPFFILGLIITVFSLLISFGSINKIKVMQAHLFNLFLLVGGLVFFIFFLRASEDRYLFMVLLPILTFISLGVFFIFDFIKTHSKIVATAFLIIFILLGAHSQFSFARELVIGKASSYQQMKDAFLWVKTNTPENAVFLGTGVEPYAIYYSERNVEAWPLGIETLPQEEFEAQIDATLEKSDYLVINAFHQTNEKILNYINSIQSRFEPFYVSFFDQEQKQPAVIIYKIRGG